MARKTFFAVAWRSIFLAVLVTAVKFALSSTPADAQAMTLADVAGGAYQRLEIVLRADQPPPPVA
jgi:hypothetical protein